MPKDERIRLQHMLDAARDGLAMVEGHTRGDLDRSKVLGLGLMKTLEIVGEAAARTAPETRERIPKIPWQQIVGMRNRLIHVYYDVDLDQIWNAVKDDLPALIEQLEDALGRWDNPGRTR